VETLEQIKNRLETAVSGVQLQIVPNDSPAQQPSLLVDVAHASAVAQFLKDDPARRCAIFSEPQAAADSAPETTRVLTSVPRRHARRSSSRLFSTDSLRRLRHPKVSR
jgi:hypothetical protein